MKSTFRGAVTGATDMVKTEFCSAADWTAQTFLGTVGLLNEASRYLPFTRKNVAYQISADQTNEMLNNASNYVHQFFKDLAPYENAYEAGEYVLNVASITNGIKSIGNITKGLGGISIGNMQVANTNMVVPVLSYSGEAIAGVSDVASLAIAGGAMYSMSNSNNSGETNSTKLGKEIHKKKADKRRESGNYDTVNEKMKDSNGDIIEVPKRRNKNGIPSKKTQAAAPDAVQGPPKGKIIDDKPLNRPISKDKQEIRRFIEAYEIKYGEKPKEIVYDPQTGETVIKESYNVEDFMW